MSSSLEWYPTVEKGEAWGLSDMTIGGVNKNSIMIRGAGYEASARVACFFPAARVLVHPISDRLQVNNKPNIKSQILPGCH